MTNRDDETGRTLLFAITVDGAPVAANLVSVDRQRAEGYLTVFEGHPLPRRATTSEHVQRWAFERCVELDFRMRDDAYVDRCSTLRRAAGRDLAHCDRLAGRAGRRAASGTAIPGRDAPRERVRPGVSRCCRWSEPGRERARPSIAPHQGWGWLASHLVRPATLLALLGVGMAGAAVLAAAMDPGWPTWLAAVVASLFSATAVSWHGVLLAEVARLSPPGRIGSTTGAVLAFGDAGSFVLPLLFSAALAVTEGYATGFVIGGTLALGVGLFGLRRRFGGGAV